MRAIDAQFEITQRRGIGGQEQAAARYRTASQRAAAAGIVSASATGRIEAAQVLVSGGNVPEEEVIAGAENLDGLPWGLLSGAAALGAALTAPGSGRLTEFERQCDNALVAYLSAARRVPFGEQPVLAYLYAREAELTAIRIVMTGRMAGLDTETIRERLRDSYV